MIMKVNSGFISVMKKTNKKKIIKKTKPKKGREKSREDQIFRESLLIISLPAKPDQRKKNQKPAVQMFGEKWVSHDNWVFFPYHTCWLAKSA